MYYTWGMLDTENIAQMISYEVRFQVFYTRSEWYIYSTPSVRFEFCRKI